MRCPIPGCSKLRQPNQLMCRQHWSMLPYETRGEIWDLFYHSKGSDEHRKACLNAIRYVSERVAPQNQPKQTNLL